MTLKTLDPLGMEVKPGDTVRSGVGKIAKFVQATRAQSVGMAGKVVVKWVGDDVQAEYYDRVFGLKVVDEPE